MTERLKTSLIEAHLIHRICSLVYLTLITFIVFWFALLPEFLLGVLIPMIPLYQISALLEYLSEHAWFREDINKEHDRISQTSSSWGRFCGDKLPEKNLPFMKATLAWFIWVTRALLYHLPVRLTIVPGDLAQHDYHHRHIDFDWTYAAYARQTDIDYRFQTKSLPYHESWGLASSISAVFKAISEKPNEEKNHE